MVSRFILIGALLALAACSVPTQRQPGTTAPAPPTVTAPAPEPAREEPDGSAEAVQGLLTQARLEREQDNFSRAEGLLRRAQRIAPRESGVYLEYARLYHQQGATGQAAAMAERGLLYCSGEMCTELRSLGN